MGVTGVWSAVKISKGHGSEQKTGAQYRKGQPRPDSKETSEGPQLAQVARSGVN